MPGHRRGVSGDASSSISSSSSDAVRSGVRCAAGRLNSRSSTVCAAVPIGAGSSGSSGPRINRSATIRAGQEFTAFAVDADNRARSTAAVASSVVVTSRSPSHASGQRGGRGFRGRFAGDFALIVVTPAMCAAEPWGHSSAFGYWAARVEWVAEAMAIPDISARCSDSPLGVSSLGEAAVGCTTSLVIRRRLLCCRYENIPRRCHAKLFPRPQVVKELSAEDHPVPDAASPLVNCARNCSHQWCKGIPFRGSVFAMTLITRVYLVDDLDGSEDDVSTVTFNLDGKNYEIDLSAANAEKLRGKLSKFTDAATKVTSKGSAAHRGSKPRQSGRPGTRRRRSGTGPAATGSMCPTVAASPGPSRKRSKRRTDKPFRVNRASPLRRPFDSAGARRSNFVGPWSSGLSGDCNAATNAKICCRDHEFPCVCCGPVALDEPKGCGMDETTTSRRTAPGRSALANETPAARSPFGGRTARTYRYGKPSKPLAP